jgi:lysophospholipase L1-like esterase
MGFGLPDAVFMRPHGGGADDAPGIAALAAAEASALRRPVVLQAGTYSINSSVTTTLGARIAFVDGAMLSALAGASMSIAGPVVAASTRLFAGSGQISTSPDFPFDPMWWGRPGSYGGDADNVLHLVFDKTGARSSLVGLRGEIVTVSRNSSATLVVGGAEVTATTNQARVDENGLLLEPACTQIFPTPSDMTNGANWDAGGTVTIAATAGDPLGGASAFRMREIANSGPHQVFALPTTAAVPTACSIYARADGRSWLRIADNGAAHLAFFNISTGAIGTLGGAGTRAEIEYVGGGWYRCSMICTPSAGGNLFAFALSTDGATVSYAGDTTKGAFLWRPQLEANEYATTWTATSRAAETAYVALPNLGPEWTIEVVASPAGAQEWNRGTHHPLAAIGTYHGANSVECYTNAGAAVLSVYDGAAAEKLITSAALAAGSNYKGERRLAFCSSGVARPAAYIDGRVQTGAPSGAGTGILVGTAIGVLRLGCTSAALVGGFRIREVRVRNTQRPCTKPLGAFSYAWQFARGYTAAANNIAFLGDSITQGIYDAAITAPFPQVAVTTKGTGYQAHNFGIGSNGTDQALARWRADIRGRGFTKMVVMIGINDVNLSLPASFVTANLTTIFQEAAADGVTVIPVTLLPRANPGTAETTNLNTINAFITSYAASHGLTRVDAYTDFDDGTGKMKAIWDIDGGSLHPNQAGQNELGAIVAAAL